MKRIEDVKAKLESLKPLLKERFQVDLLGYLARLHVENTLLRAT